MAKRGQDDDVWEAVLAEWYPGGLPDGKSPLRTKINRHVTDLRNQGATGSQIDLWIIRCKAEMELTRDPWPASGCTLEACAKHINNPRFKPKPATYRECLERRFVKWKAGLPPEWRTYVDMLMHKDMARQCWLGAAGQLMDRCDPLIDSARKEWGRLDKINKHHTEMRNGKVVSLLDEMNTVLKKYLPGGTD